MVHAQRGIESMVTRLVPMLSRSLAEQFNVLRVMRHGTHEKQLSNVFAWLLDPAGTHHLGGAFQSIFLTALNEQLPAGSEFPTSGYEVIQEVDTSGADAEGKDIADIVLRGADHCVVVENFGTSDGHGHDYMGYLAHGMSGGRRSAVVLLCISHDPALQRDGWEHASVLTYERLLSDLHSHIRSNRAWRAANPRQDTFISELHEHFVGGADPVSIDDNIAFITSMCETGEAARYGLRPQDAAAEEFANQIALHARQQFDEGRRTLAEIKRLLRLHAERFTAEQVNARLAERRITSVSARMSGTWEWYVRLLDGEGSLVAGFVFGPTAMEYLGIARSRPSAPDYGRVFVVVRNDVDVSDSRVVETDVSLAEVLQGLPSGDARLANAVLEAIG